MKSIRKKLRSACFTLVLIFIFSAASIIYSKLHSFQPTTASANNSSILIAYRDVKLLEHDLNYFGSLNMNYSIPRYGVLQSKSSISIIIEMQEINDVLKSVKLLKKHRIPAIIALFDTMNIAEIELIRKEYGDIEFQFAFYYDCFPQDCIEFCTELSDARLEYYMSFGESCKNIVLSDGSRTLEDIGYLPVHSFSDLTFIGFGNGVNSVSSDRNLYNRIVRIPELSMEQYFSEIAH